MSSLEDLVVDFSISTSKWVIGKANAVYFQAFASKDRKAEFVIEKAQVVKKSSRSKKESKLKKVPSKDYVMGSSQSNPTSTPPTTCGFSMVMSPETF